MDKHAWVLQNSEIMEDLDVGASCNGVFEGVQRTSMDHVVRMRNEICTAQVPRFLCQRLARVRSFSTTLMSISMRPRSKVRSNSWPKKYLDHIQGNDSTHIMCSSNMAALELLFDAEEKPVIWHY